MSNLSGRLGAPHGGGVLDLSAYNGNVYIASPNDENALQIDNSGVSLSFGFSSLNMTSGTATLSAEASLILTGATSVILITPAPPATAGDQGEQGEIRIDDSFIYICTAEDTWKRVAIATW